MTALTAIFFVCAGILALAGSTAVLGCINDIQLERKRTFQAQVSTNGRAGS